MSVVELVVSLVPVLLEKLASSELLRFLKKEGLSSKITTLTHNLGMIQTVLRDAELKQLSSSDVERWLDDLQDLAYDVEDILDEFDTNILEKKLKKKQHQQAGTSMAGQFLSTNIRKLSCKAIKSRARMGSNIKKVKERLEHITKGLEDLNKLRDQLGLKKTNAEASTSTVAQHRLLTLETETERVVYGREEEKSKILELVSTEEPSATNFQVIPIVGMGGIGKSTLARKVYNHEAVKSFDPKAWVCVSNYVDAVTIWKAIIDNISDQPCNHSDTNAVQKQLGKLIAGKKFMFVLDDVSSKHCSWWEFLKSPFKVGANGSKIIVTTREEAVASTMESSKWLHRVQKLSDNDCWCLFTGHAFGNSSNPMHPDIQSIREKILKRSKGLPLAAKVLGGFLRQKNINEWLEILWDEVWDLAGKSDDMLTTLKVSFFYLPPQLKRCFAYCSILLEDYEFGKEELILLWLTQGLILPAKEKKLPEELGGEYFDDLLSRSLLHRSSDNKTKYVMHDLVLDLSRWASRKTFFHLGDKSNIDRVRYLSYSQDFLEVKNKFEAISTNERAQQHLRSFWPFQEKEVFYHSGKYMYRYIAPTVIFDLLPKFKRLRMLSLEGYGIIKLPESIGDLRHLRHLNLSYTKIYSLPESTSSLINLLILRLKGCIHLKKLPSKMRNLTKLRYLDIRGVGLNDMPLGLDELKDLQYLSHLVVNKDSAANWGALKNMISMSELGISGLENANDKWDMILAENKKLKELHLEWNSTFDDTRRAKKEKIVLRLLKPCIDLERLIIKCYGGKQFPSWVGSSSISRLTVLTLESCWLCEGLPPLGQLEWLKHLTIKEMNGLKQIGREFFGNHVSKPFPSLETLYFVNLKEWVYWEQMNENEYDDIFPSLQVLHVKNCKVLYGSLPCCLPSLQDLVIKNCHRLVVSFSSLPKLRTLKIRQCSQVACLEQVDFKSLESADLWSIDKFSNGSAESDQVLFLMVNFFSNLRKLRIVDHFNLTSLLPYHRITCLERLELRNCNSMKCIVNGPLPSSLKRLDISSCQGLEYLWDDREEHSNTNASLEYLSVYYCASLTSISLSGRLSTTLSTLILKCVPNLKSIDNISDWSKQKIENNVRLEDGLLPDKLAGEVRIHKPLQQKDLYIEEGLGEPDRGMRLPLSLSKLSISNLNCLMSQDFQNLPSLQSLEIFQCLGLTSLSKVALPSSLQSLKIWYCPTLISLLEAALPSSLQSLKIYHCPSLTSLSEAALPSSLQYLKIYHCPSLTSLSETALPSSLQCLDIEKCPGLTSLSEFALSSSLQSLKIYHCPGLTSLSEATLPSSLQSLKIYHCLGLTSLSEVARPSSLQSLVIKECPGLTSFTEAALPSSLQSLVIKGCPSLTSLSEATLPFLLQSLDICECPGLTSLSKAALPSSLQSLDIYKCPGLTSLSKAALPSSLQSLCINHCLGFTSLSKAALPSSLQSLVIRKCPGLTFISKWGLPSSLLKLTISECPNLSLLAEQRLPSSLLYFDIEKCEKLKEDCKRKKGKIWSNISHIPRLLIDGKSIDEIWNEM